MTEASELTHRPDCDPRERTRASCPCGVLDAWIQEAIDRFEQERELWNGRHLDAWYDR